MMTRSPLRLAIAVAVCSVILVASRPALAQSATGAKGATASPTAGTAGSAKRPLQVSDLFRVRDVQDIQLSPDGQWVAYAVSSPDSARDRSNTDLYMTSWDGRQTVQLTSSQESETTPRWSPDGRYLGFLSSREDSSETSQLWLLDRRGGEAKRVTSGKLDINEFAWSPDGSRIVLAMEDDPDAVGSDSVPKDTTAAKHGGVGVKAKPIVVDRYYFKEDVTGYLGKKRNHLYLLDVATKKLDQLTSGSFEEREPAWSPDGRRIAFVSKRGPGDVDKANNWDVFVMEARPGAVATQLTTSPGQDNPPESGRPAWSPDGSMIAYVRGSPDPKMYAYDQHELAVIAASGGQPKALTTALDRPVSNPRWSANGRSITILVTDDRSQYPAQVDVSSGKVTRLLPGTLVASEFAPHGADTLAALIATDTTPAEVYAVENGRLRQLSHHNDEWLSTIQLAPTEEFASKSKDGTEVHGLLVKPLGWTSGRRVPTLLRIHGGPNGQDEHAFSFERQLFAANGYLVVAPNYRGSSGRGLKYQSAIMSDWGHKEVVDLLGAIDHVVAAGLADQSRLGIGGWSYGGILTDYTIATDKRFKGATSGAGSALQLGMYGVDEYITQYVAELGQPWEHPDLWMKVSYPFLHADRITTPTLFLGGEKDFNVPLNGSEQMYQALRSLGVPTQLIIYPGQFHGITRPSFRTDRLQRYLDWYGKYVKPEVSATASGRGD